MASVPPPSPPIPHLPRPAFLAKVAAGVAIAVITSHSSKLVLANNPHHHPFASASASLLLASMSLSPPAQVPVAVEAATGTQFPTTVNLDKGKLQLAGTGLRKKNVLGLKSIVVYAFGVYVNANRLREEKKTGIELSEMPCLDVEMSVRLVIVYGSLKIGSVRSAFEESIGGRIKKFTGSNDKDLLHSFTEQFRDDIKLPKGTTIDIVRLPGHVLRTKIDGKELGSVKSDLLCRCLFDLYVGEEPFDVGGRDAIAAGLASMLTS